MGMAPCPDENLGIWQLKDLKGAASNAELGGCKVEVTVFLSAEGEAGTVTSFSASSAP
uniref:Zinc finger CCCH domain-containing protein 22 isoform X3 n=1 Tax=Rhizophora mucronata TaxID=61149 RepID=A0A2P2M8F4_RHIMU